MTSGIAQISEGGGEKQFLNYELSLKQKYKLRNLSIKYKQQKTPWPESASELYRSSDRRL
jgi:hypothetical protein